MIDDHIAGSGPAALARPLSQLRECSDDRLLFLVQLCQPGLCPAPGVFAHVECRQHRTPTGEMPYVTSVMDNAPARIVAFGPLEGASEVLAHHGDAIRVLHAVRPIGVAMAGGDTFDPYKD